MGARLEELKTCNDLIEKHGQALQVNVVFNAFIMLRTWDIWVLSKKSNSFAQYHGVLELQLSLERYDFW